MNIKVIKLLSCFIPVKKWRKNFRRHFEKKNNIVVESTIHNTELPLIEIFLQQFNKDKTFNRFDTIVRLLAIENYYGLNDFGWDLYAKMQQARVCDKSTMEYKEHFLQLIKSWDTNGYDRNSQILVNGDMKLIDGSHRLAMALFHRIDKLSMKVDTTLHTPQYGIDWFYEKNFSLEEINFITSRFNKLLQDYDKGVYISCILWAPLAKYFDEVTEKINSMFPVSNIKDMEFSEDTYARMVRAIYKIDDIADWKIEKKIEYMQSAKPKKIRFMNIYVENPTFRFKQSNFNSILVQGEVLKRVFRNCYKDKIDNYFYDILVHTGDNTTQTEYINKLYNIDLNLEEYFKAIRNFDYLIVKFETENMTKDFPKTFPFSKDIDIICCKNDFKELTLTTKTFFTNLLQNNYEIKFINVNEYHTQIRIELNNFLIYQFDISVCFEGCQNAFIENSLKNKIKKSSFFIPKLEDEIVYRLAEYIKNPKKIQHYNYLKNHIQYFDFIDLKNSLSDTFYNSYKLNLSKEINKELDD